MTDFPFEAYRRWLYKTAAEMLPGGPFDDGLEDLVQEGWIAMWRALDGYDNRKGALVSWATRAASTRMKDLAWGHGRTTGHAPARGFTEARGAVYIDAMEDPGDLALAESMVDMAEPVLMDVLSELPHEQREYIWLRFWCGVEISSRVPGIRAMAAQYPVLKKKWVWARARQTLSQDPRIRQIAGQPA